MSLSVFTVEIPKLYAPLQEMEANISYIRQKLTQHEMPDVLRTDISQVCEEFESVLYDVRKEIRTLEDKLGMHPGEEPFDPDAVNPDPRVNMGFMRDWLQTEINALNEIVTRVDNNSSEDPKLVIVSILVTESATNILRSFAIVHRALGAIDAALRAAPSDAAIGTLGIKKEQPQIYAEAKFVCSICGKEACHILLLRTSGSIEVSRRSFTSTMSGRSLPIEKLRAAIERQDARKLFQIDFELTPFYCPGCNACYCGDHWHRWDVFDEDEPSFHDSIRGRCPKGHERMLED